MNRQTKWITGGAAALIVLVVAALVLAVKLGDHGAAGQGVDYSYLSTTALRDLDIDVGGDDAVTPTGNLKEFELVAKETEWELVSGVTATADTFNGTVPGPTIRVTEGDTVRVTLKNDLPEETSIHWHGLHVPNEMDGVAGVTQDAIMPGETFTYEFVASHAGTFMYHSHSRFSREQIDHGLYGLFIIDSQHPGVTTFDREYTLALQGWMAGGEMADGMGSDAMSMDYNYFTINGKSFPDTQPLVVSEGDLVRLRIVNPSQTTHPMHLHGQDFLIVAKDGEPLDSPQTANVVDVQQGDTYDLVFIANNPGNWALHCHDLHHASNNGVEPGGLTVLVQYEGYEPGDDDGIAPTPTPQSGSGGMDQDDEMPGTGGMDEGDVDMEDGVWSKCPGWGISRVSRTHERKCQS